MPFDVSFLLYRWVLLLCATSIFPWSIPRTAVAADALPGYVVAPIILVDRSNQAAVRVKINEQPTFLVFDTGASGTILDRGFYRSLVAKATSNPESKLPAELQHKTFLANGKEKVGVGYVDAIMLGSTKIGGGPIAVADFSGLFGAYNNAHPNGQISGLLGEDTLHRYAAIIDWGRHGVYFNTDPKKRLKFGPGLTAAGWTAVPMTTTSAHHFAVPCTVDDKPVRLVVDTGAQFTTFDRGAITLKNPMYGRPSRGSMDHLATYKMSSSMFGMNSSAYLARLENWKIGNYTIPRSVVMTNNMPPGLTTHGSGGEGPVVGVLGAEVLASNNAIVDVAGSILYLKSSASAARRSR